MDTIVKYMIERKWADDEKTDRKVFLWKLAQKSKEEKVIMVKPGARGLGLVFFRGGARAPQRRLGSLAEGVRLASDQTEVFCTGTRRHP